MNKVFTWLKALGATILGLFQALLKVIKELGTGIVNLVSIVVPFDISQLIIEEIRDRVNLLDSFVEKQKNKLLENIL